MSFAFKKFVSFLLNPLSLTLELVLFGLLLLVLARWRAKGVTFSGRRKCCFNVGTGFVLFGSALLYVAGLDPVANRLAGHLEEKIPALPEKDGRVETEAEPEFIVVLAGGERAAPNKPALSGLTHHAFARVVGGVTFWQQFPGAKIAFTGRPDETGAMRAVAERLGVPSRLIVEETQSRDTKDHPIYLKPILRQAPFFLVTSATHMPRADALFRKQGLEPIPAPVDFISVTELDEGDAHHHSPVFPTAANLLRTTTALHEMLGLAWAKLRGQID